MNPRVIMRRQLRDLAKGIGNVMVSTVPLSAASICLSDVAGGWGFGDFGRMFLEIQPIAPLLEMLLG